MNELKGTLLNHEIVKIEKGDDIESILYDVAIGDCDFIGENGEEYLWDVAKEKGFESNYDYVINEISVLNDTEQKINAFFSLWIDEDRYYDGYDLEFIRDNQNNVVAFSYVIVQSEN